MIPLRTVAAELRHAVDFAGQFARGREPVGRFVVVVVHDDDAVEPFEVGFAQRTGAVREFVTAPGGGTPHPRIGQVAGVSRIGAGRIGFDTVAQRLASDLRAEDLFGGRRAADIAQADKKDSGFHRRTKIVQAERRTKFIWFCRGTACLSGNLSSAKCVCRVQNIPADFGAGDISALSESDRSGGSAETMRAADRLVSPSCFPLRLCIKEFPDRNKM